MRVEDELGGFNGLLQEWRPSGKQRIRARIRIYATAPYDQQALEEVAKTEEGLERMDDAGIEFAWGIRKWKVMNNAVRYATMVEKECERRYEGFTRKPIQIRLPYFTQLDPRKVKNEIKDLIEGMDWPTFLKNWHKAQTKIVTESQPTIGEIMSNVTKPWTEMGKCACAEIKRRRGPRDPTLPEIDGHIFFISRDYKGCHERALEHGANNIPTQTEWDLKRAWEKVGAPKAHVSTAGDTFSADRCRSFALP